MRFPVFILFFCSLLKVNAHPAIPARAEDIDSSLLQKKSIAATFLDGDIKIDGLLNEKEWSTAQKADRFVQSFPNPGKPSRQNTEVWIMYDNNAIYVGAWLHEVSKDSIIRTLSSRDENDNADLFNVSFDTYNDDQNAFAFSVTSAGVQIDTRISAAGEDELWNAVWYSAVKLHEKGWTVEMRIPFSALRFPASEMQTWGINFFRNIRRFREDSNWSYVNPLVPGVVNQFGDLTNLKNIESPVRLSFTPYVSGYYTRYDDSPNNIHEASTSFNGGMDLKYGINEAFTLDMTMIPDFGQVQSDNLILNTTPFEVKYNEFRQFFTEGTEIYNKSGLFYSRRIGGQPMNYHNLYEQISAGETVTENPQSTRLLNATKITGRTNKGTGIGFFNAVTGNSYARIHDSLGRERKVLTDPMTNYNVFVIDQNLKNNSYVNLTNTSVLRNGGFYDANVTGLNTKLNTKGNKFGLGLMGVLTQQIGLYKPGVNQLGHAAGITLDKQGGNYTYGLSYSEESDTYDPNDLGYLENNNSRNFSLAGGHYIYEPRKHFLNSWTEAWVNYTRLYNPNAYVNTTIGSNSGGTFRNWLTIDGWLSLNVTPSYDYFEPRVKGRFYAAPRWGNIGGFISSDYRKKFALDLKVNLFKYDYKNWYAYNVTLTPRYRFSDKLSAIFAMYYGLNYGEQGSALRIDGSPTIINDTVVFAIRDRHTYENTLSVKYNFTNKMALTFRVRHYWSKLIYSSFYTLEQNGNLGPSAYPGVDFSGNSLHDNSFNAFNVDMVYTWVFAPGSELRVVWKNSIYDFSQNTRVRYTNDFYSTIKSPQTNSFSIKLIYYLDVLMFRKR